jgi:hypothetical protein
MRGAALIAAAFIAGPACAQDSISPEVRAVIARTRNPDVDYSVVHTERVTFEGRTFEQTSAEYERGPMHRVETLPARGIANCETGTTIILRADNQRIQQAHDDWGACGIADSEPVLSSRMLPAVTGPWGRADVIELTGRDFVRRYVVTEDGIIVSGNYTPLRPDVRYAVETLRVMVTRGTPDPAMFEEASLRRTFAEPLPEDAPPAP